MLHVYILRPFMIILVYDIFDLVSIIFQLYCDGQLYYRRKPKWPEKTCESSL